MGRFKLMKNMLNTKKMTLSAMFLALALVLPFLTGQIPEIGSMLCPMHIPVILAGYICSGPWGFIVGLIAPILRSLIFAAPPMFPKAVAMSFELAAYGLFSSLLSRRLSKKISGIYISLIISMILGRLVWGVAMFALTSFSGGTFGLAAFISSAVINALPGIAVQLIVIPVIIIMLQRKHITK